MINNKRAKGPATKSILLSTVVIMIIWKSHMKSEQNAELRVLNFKDNKGNE